MPVEKFHFLLEHGIGFNRFLMRQFNERLGQLISYKAPEQMLPIERQLARSLASLFGHNIFPAAAPSLEITQQESAYLAGTSHQQVSLALGMLRDAGAVEAAYGGVRLLDYARLFDLAK